MNIHICLVDQFRVYNFVTSALIWFYCCSLSVMHDYWWFCW